MRLFYLVFGSGAIENSVLSWAAEHRVHHSHVDEERDPYNIKKGFWWAHVGWILYDSEPANPTVVRDLAEDPLVRWQDRNYKWLAPAVAFGIPLIVGLATGRVLGCLLIGGVLRVVVSHHGTFFINSLCHMVGRQPYSTEHSARDSSIMAILAFGEGYHNYHHSFPFDYRNGVKVWQFDPAKWMIWAFSKVGLVRDLRRAPEAAVLKAKIEVQFERAKERLQKVVHDFREHHEAQLHDVHTRLQEALHDLLSLQRRSRPKPVPADQEHLPLETRVGLDLSRSGEGPGRMERDPSADEPAAGGGAGLIWRRAPMRYLASVWLLAGLILASPALLSQEKREPAASQADLPALPTEVEAAAARLHLEATRRARGPSRSSAR